MGNWEVFAIRYADQENRTRARAFLMDDNPTAENIAKLIFEQAAKLNLPVVAVRLWETPDAYAEYRADADD